MIKINPSFDLCKWESGGKAPNWFLGGEKTIREQIKAE